MMAKPAGLIARACKQCGGVHFPGACVFSPQPVDRDALLKIVRDEMLKQRQRGGQL